MPKITYIQKNFRTESLERIAKINKIVDEYKMQGYELTLRQVYYQMVARDIIPNNERSYKNLGSLINEARLAGLIDWLAIEDRTRNLRGNNHWSTPKEIIESARWSYHIDYWEDQENYVEVWVEKDALVGIVGQVCEELDVNYFSCRGYVSQSEMWSAANRIKRQQEKGKHIVLLHLGDHDPSGIDMSRDIGDRQALFGAKDIEFHRIALNMDQIDYYGPPPNPTKITDSRSNGYIKRFGHECWELDALEPSVITTLIRENVIFFRDEELFENKVLREKEEIQMLKNIEYCYNDLSENWDEIAGRYFYDIY